MLCITAPVLRVLYSRVLRNVRARQEGQDSKKAAKNSVCDVSLSDPTVKRSSRRNNLLET